MEPQKARRKGREGRTEPRNEMEKSLMAGMLGSKRDAVVLRPQLSARQDGPTNRKAVTWVQSQLPTSIYGAAAGCWQP